MRESFSAEVVDLQNQAPNRNRRECKYYWDELYTLINAAGFEYMEIPYQPKWDFGGRSGIPLTNRSVTTKFDTVGNYIDTLKGYGLKGLTGIHFDSTLFCGGHIDMYFGAMQHFAEEALQFAKEAGAEYFTMSVTPTWYAVHSLQPEGMSDEEFEQQFLAKNKEAIEHLAEVAEGLGIRLCLKNEYWTLLYGEKIVPYVESLKHKVSIDADLAHLQIADTDVKRFVELNIDKIGVVHITDTDFADGEEARKQVMPEAPASKPQKVLKDIGKGTVDIKAIYEVLKQKAYDGTVVYNCKDSYDPCRSLLRTRYFINHNL